MPPAIREPEPTGHRKFVPGPRFRAHLGIYRGTPARLTRIPTRPYRGFAIIPRTFQVRGSGLWTIDIVIRRWGLLRTFSTHRTADTEQAAHEMCWSLGRGIIDRSRNVTSLADLVDEKEDA